MRRNSISYIFLKSMLVQKLHVTVMAVNKTIWFQRKTHFPFSVDAHEQMKNAG